MFFRTLLREEGELNKVVIDLNVKPTDTKRSIRQKLGIQDPKIQIEKIDPRAQQVALGFKEDRR